MSVSKIAEVKAHLTELLHELYRRRELLWGELQDFGEEGLLHSVAMCRHVRSVLLVGDA